MSPASAPHAAHAAAAAAAWPTRVAFRIGGRDAIAFLQRVVTADVSGLRPGGGVRTLLLDAHGHVIADLDLWADADGLVVGTHIAARERALQELARRVLRADVVLTPLADASLALHGPAAGAVLASLGVEPPPPDPYAHRRATLDGMALHARRTEYVPGGLEVAASDQAAIAALLRRLADTAQVEMLDGAQSEALRVEAGIAEWGAELTGAEFPQELGLEAAVSFEKGCYLGQETVARIQYRGHVNRLLRGLRLPGPARPGDVLYVDGRQAGTITSFAQSARHGAIALAWLRRAHAVAGTRVRLADEGEALVVALPFA